jgi:O-phosphoseryl-tRNA(Cys) synthetase
VNPTEVLAQLDAAHVASGLPGKSTFSVAADTIRALVSTVDDRDRLIECLHTDLHYYKKGE